jgi:hypothetical protein
MDQFRREPESIDEFVRYKSSIGGMKDSSFMMGTRSLMNLISENALYPFVPKNGGDQKIYKSYI